MTTEAGADRRLHNRALLGVGLMILGLSLYPLSDAFIKHLMVSYSVCQTTLLRSITRLIPLFIATFFHGGPRKVLYSKHPKNHMIRLAVNLFYTLSFMIAFSLASLTTIYTFSYTSPFFMILLGALMLKEKISLDRWFAVGIGLIGVMIAMRPGSSVIESAAILVLFGTFLSALNKILMRRLAATDHSLAIAIYPNLVMIVAMLLLALISSVFPEFLPSQFSFVWKSMPLEHWGLFAIVGALTAGAQYAIAQALRFAQASTLAPIDYSTFFWVVALDFVWWNKTPDPYTLFGAAIIVGSNLYILFRTRKEDSSKKAAKPAQAV
ncbi:MAG: DMT family transporter [Chlamydiae bacterium]|nr:DMT family transporter [Chlamydiota bacterium]